MDGLIVHIGWEYFLGVMASLTLIAWYSNGRFTALETSMSWVKETLNAMKVNADNESSPSPAFGASSPNKFKTNGRTLVGGKWFEKIY
jgi:hypothetical protein